MYLIYQLVGEDHQLTYNHRNACLLYYLQCSKSCDKGEQTRQATCVDTFGEILIDRDCRPKDKQALRQQCNNFKCPWWTEGVWSSVSRTFLKFQFCFCLTGCLSVCLSTFLSLSLSLSLLVCLSVCMKQSIPVWVLMYHKIALSFDSNILSILS